MEWEIGDLRSALLRSRNSARLSKCLRPMAFSSAVVKFVHADFSPKCPSFGAAPNDSAPVGIKRDAFSLRRLSGDEASLAGDMSPIIGGMSPPVHAHD